MTYSCFGPIARICLKTIIIESEERYNQSLVKYLRKVDLEIQCYIANSGRITFDNKLPHQSSHKMALMQPIDKGLSYTPRIATRWLAYRVYERALQRSQEDCFMLYKHLSGQRSLRSSAGCFFEGYVHEWLQDGGSFLADMIPIDNQNLLQLRFNIQKIELDSPNHFSTPESLFNMVKTRGGRGIHESDISKYFRPVSRNYPSIDGLLFRDRTTLILLQMTIVSKHAIKPHGVAELLQALPMIITNVYIVFVVPEDCSESYARAQSIPNVAEICTRRKNLQVKQFRLVFNDEDIQKVVVQGPSIQLEEDDDEDSFSE